MKKGPGSRRGPGRPMAGLVGRHPHFLNVMTSVYEADYVGVPEIEETPEERYRSIDEIEKEIKALEKTMREAAKALEFERAAQVRDRIKNLRSKEFGLK